MIRNQHEHDERMLRNVGREFEGYRYPYQSQQFSPYARFQPQEQNYMSAYGAGSPYGPPMEEFYYQGLAPRGYLGQSPALGNPYLGQSTAYRSLGPGLYDPMNRLVGNPDIGGYDPMNRQHFAPQAMLPQAFTPPQFAAPSFRGIGPKGYVRPDERIKEDVCERLFKHPDIDASDVSVEAKQGVVVLAGTVIDRMTKHQIEDLVDNVIGVKDIENNITVRPRALLEAGMVGRGPAQSQGETQAEVGKPRH